MKLQFPFVSRRQHDRVAAEGAYAAEELAAKTIVNDRLTDDLTKTKEQLAAYNGSRTVAEVLEEHEAHRQAIADAIGYQDPHLTWDRLTAVVAHIAKVAAEWQADYKVQKDRAELFEAQLDDARQLAARLTAAAETRQALDDAERPVDAALSARREAPSARLRRERDRVRKLEQRLSDMQLSHVADTRELHDLRQKEAGA